MFDHEYDYRPNWRTRTSVTNYHNFKKICDIKGSFFESKHKKFQAFLASSKISHLSAHDMTRTVLLNCPIKAEIRAVDNQSDLRIFYGNNNNNNNNNNNTKYSGNDQKASLGP